MPRRDLVKTTATVDGVPQGEFTTFAGGELTSADIKTVRGAGQVERARGGRKQVGNVTVSREYNNEDLAALAAKRGRASMSVTRQALDEDGNPSGKPLTYNGKLLRVGPGPGDSQSTTDVDMFELEMSCDGEVA